MALLEYYLYRDDRWYSWNEAADAGSYHKRSTAGIGVKSFYTPVPFALQNSMLDTDTLQGILCSRSEHFSILSSKEN